MLPSDFACPRCKCRACYALHRKGLDWVMSLAGLRPARCLTCNRRFYARYTMTENGKYVPGVRKRELGAVRLGPAPAKGERKVMDTAA